MTGRVEVMESALYQQLDESRNGDQSQNMLCTHDWASGTMLAKLDRDWVKRTHKKGKAEKRVETWA